MLGFPKSANFLFSVSCLLLAVSCRNRPENNPDLKVDHSVPASDYDLNIPVAFFTVDQCNYSDSKGFYGQLSDDKATLLVCTGTRIDTERIATAAHCLSIDRHVVIFQDFVERNAIVNAKREPSSKQNYKQFKLSCAEVNQYLKEPLLRGRAQIIAPRFVWTHPDYTRLQKLGSNLSYRSYDVGLVRIGDFLADKPIIPLNETLTSLTGKNIYAIGLGATNCGKVKDGQFVNIRSPETNLGIGKAKMQILNTKKSSDQEIFAHGVNYFNRNEVDKRHAGAEMFWFKNLDDSLICAGDSGAGLYFETANGYRLFSVVSTAFGTNGYNIVTGPRIGDKLPTDLP